MDWPTRTRMKQAPLKSASIAWEEPSKTNDVYFYLSPVLANCRVVGSSPFDAAMRTSPLRIVLAVFLMSIMVTTGGLYGYNSFGIPYTTTANGIVYMTIVALAIFTTLLLVFFTIRQRLKLRLALDKIRAVDSKLLKMGVLYKYDRKEIFVEIFLRAFFKICMVVFDWIVYKQSLGRASGSYVIVSLYYSYFVIYPIQHQYTALMKVVHRHFSVLSKCAQVHTSNKDVIHRFLEAHFEMCEVCQIISEWFSPQLLFICTCVFLTTTLNLNAMVMALISFLDPLPPQITIFISSTFWVSARLYEMWEILDVCSKTERKAEKLGRYLSNLIIDDEMKNDNELLDLHFHVQPKVSISASGFFKLNNSVFQSMLASATTYIVIIIQIQPQMHGKICSEFMISNGSNITVPLN